MRKLPFVFALQAINQRYNRQAEALCPLKKGVAVFNNGSV